MQEEQATSRSRVVTLLGVATCAYWLSRAVFPSLLVPLGPIPDFTDVLSTIPTWMREMQPSTNRPDAVIVGELRREVLRMAAFAWALIAVGTLAGVLVAMRRSAGRWLALALATYVLFAFVLGNVQMLVAGESANPFRYWRVVVQAAPLLAVRRVVDVLWASASILLLARRSTGGVLGVRTGPDKEAQQG